MTQRIYIVKKEEEDNKRLREWRLSLSPEEKVEMRLELE